MTPKNDLKNIAIISTVVLFTGVYLIATMSLISKDGVRYINCARQFSTTSFRTYIKDISVSPGYEILIHGTHNIVGALANNNSITCWIVSAQTVSLISRLIASILLYLVGCCLTDRKTAFWGVCILSILPDAADYGSDALTEWPYLMFLSAGFLMLLWGTKYKKIWLFGLAGAASGLGFLIRSECFQPIIYGCVWLAFILIRPKNEMTRPKTAFAMVFLVLAFLIITAPYMKLTGYIFPRNHLLKLPSLFSATEPLWANHIYEAGILPFDTMGNKGLISNICQTLMFYFVPALVIGGYYYFRKQIKSHSQMFYAAAFIIFNILLEAGQLILTDKHYLSRRHTLALVAFTIFFIPVGINIIADRLDRRNSAKKDACEKIYPQWFHILISIGILICLPKLFRLTETQKTGYRNAAEWLNKNTLKSDVIAVPDTRLAFYAERPYLESNENTLPQADYFVQIAKKGNKTKYPYNAVEKYSTWLNKKKRDRVIIYQLMRQ